MYTYLTYFSQHICLNRIYGIFFLICMFTTNILYCLYCINFLHECLIIYYRRKRRGDDDDQWRNGKGGTTSKRRDNKLYMWLYGRRWFNDTV